MSWWQIPPYLIGCFVISVIFGYIICSFYFQIKNVAIKSKGSDYTTSVNKATPDTPKPPIVKK